jgi:hypothetical protein
MNATPQTYCALSLLRVNTNLLNDSFNKNQTAYINETYTNAKRTLKLLCSKREK